ncbi:MAG: hypothetical protein RSG23_10565 [Gordonibacter sp.]|uniref:hypothetical protein n=1 Tax=Gordonibacter sp. TaxID=1968902 RepID=UPI002FC96720
MACIKSEARPRYQRQPRNVQPRRSTAASYHKRNCDLLGASLAVALCIAIVWGFGWAYQMGYETGHEYASKTEASS